MRKIIIFVSLSASLLFLAVGLVLFAVKEGIPKELIEYKSSHEWGADAHSHVTVYMSSDRELDYSEKIMIESELEAAYTVDSIDSSKAIYCASTETGVSLYSTSSSRHASSTATVYSGDYFNFYKPELKEGAYPINDPIHTDAILLDENAAWQIFGTHTGVVGLSLDYNGYSYTVCGVIKVPDGIYKEVYGERSRVFISSQSTGFRNNNIMYTQFDAMIPDPITNYATNLIKEKFVAYSDVIVNQDNRFDGEELNKLRENTNDMIINSNGIDYPFTEKAALLLALKAGNYNAAMKVMYYICAFFAAVLFFAVYTPVMRFIGKQLKKLKF